MGKQVVQSLTLTAQAATVMQGLEPCTHRKHRGTKISSPLHNVGQQMPIWGSDQRHGHIMTCPSPLQALAQQMPSQGP